MIAYRGIHYIADLVYLNVPENFSGLIREQITKQGLNIVGYSEHKFTPQGETFVFLLSESHLSVHTWPELNKMAVDIYTCNNTGATHNLAQYIKQVCGAKAVGIETYLKRL